MFGTLTIKVADWDDDYLGLEIQASQERFGGSTRVYAGLNDLTELAERISGFPQSAADVRKYEFGSHEPNVAGGFCSMRFSCVDGSGHARLDLVFNDDNGLHEEGSASFGFRVLASEIDRFVLLLRALEARKVPEAKLEAVQ